MNDWANDLKTPSMLSNNFFELVPPTPGQPIQGLRPTSTYHPPNPTAFTGSIDPSLTQARSSGHNGITPHLGPAPSFASWRTYRSGSSTDSRASSNLDSWSNITGSSDTSTDSDQNIGGVMGPIDFGLGDMSSGRPKRNVAKPVTLSIDPNLFRPKSGSGGMSTCTAKAVQIHRVDGDEEMATAKPKKGGRGAMSPKGKKVSHARKHNTDHIPRPRNAFILFRKHVVDAKLIPASVEIRHQNVSVIVAKMWADAPQDQKDRFNELAKVEKEEHMKKYPGYRYQPVYRRTNVIRRRVRKDEAEEEKCKNVAELLLKGKSGEQLEVEIKEKMQQPLVTKPRKSRKVSQANELSKGALRALRAAARAQAESEKSGSLSRSQSISSRAQSVDTDAESQSQGYDSRRGSIISDIDLGGKFDMGSFGFNPGQLAQDGYQFGLVPGLGQSYSLDGGMGGWAPVMPGQSHFNGQGLGRMQQTWAYPEQEQTLMHMPDFAYQQPALMDPFFNYDQALPFSPTANQFNQTFSFPQAGSSHMANSDHLLNQGTSSYSMPYFSQPQQVQQQPSLQPPQSARWDVSFQPGGEGLPFDENALLGDFGAALLQAEEMGVW